MVHKLHMKMRGEIIPTTLGVTYFMDSRIELETALLGYLFLVLLETALLS